MTANNPSAAKRLNKVLASMTPAPSSVKSAAQQRLAAILEPDQLALRVYLRTAQVKLPKPIQLGRLDELAKRPRRNPLRTR